MLASRFSFAVIRFVCSGYLRGLFEVLETSPHLYVHIILAARPLQMPSELD